MKTRTVSIAAKVKNIRWNNVKAMW